jgi:hypothetical protein
MGSELSELEKREAGFRRYCTSNRRRAAHRGAAPLTVRSAQSPVTQHALNQFCFASHHSSLALRSLLMVVTNSDDDPAATAQKHLAKIGSRLTPNEILDPQELEALQQSIRGIWSDSVKLFMETAESGSVDRAITHAQIRREIARFEREVDEAVTSPLIPLSGSL